MITYVCMSTLSIVMILFSSVFLSDECSYVNDLSGSLLVRTVFGSSTWLESVQKRADSPMGLGVRVLAMKYVYSDTWITRTAGDH